MAHDRDERDAVTALLAQRIAEEVHPWRAVLFGSRARGDAQAESDCDLFVELDAGTERRVEVAERIRQLFSDLRWWVDVHVREPGSIERRRDDPGTIEWEVARQGILLYAHRDAPTQLQPTGRVRERPDEPPESLAQWLAVADRDLRHARHLIETTDDFWEDICFLSQQSAEKHLKALLISRHIRPERTHRLDRLLSELRAAGCDMTGLDEICVHLTRYAVAPRYTWLMECDEEAARAAIEAAEQVAMAVRADLPRRIH